MHQAATGIRALITPPTAPVLSLAACKAALGITGAGQDGMVETALAASVAQLDPASGGWLGRALRPQTWELRLPGFLEHRCTLSRFGAGAIALPYPKLIQVVSIKFDEPGGAEKTLLEETDFRILGAGSTGKQAVAPAHGRCWPSVRCGPEAVRIRYECGYRPAVGADPGPAAPDEMPAQLLQAVVLGARLLISTAGQNPFLVGDRVEGVGEQRFGFSDAALKVVENAQQELLNRGLRVFG